MQPHEQRVVDEKADLDVKLTALQKFIETSPIFQQLSALDKELLEDQAMHMFHYSNTLRLRITRFPTGEK